MPRAHKPKWPYDAVFQVAMHAIGEDMDTIRTKHSHLIDMMKVQNAVDVLGMLDVLNNAVSCSCVYENKTARRQRVVTSAGMQKPVTAPMMERTPSEKAAGEREEIRQVKESEEDAADGSTRGKDHMTTRCQQVSRAAAKDRRIQQPVSRNLPWLQAYQVEDKVESYKL